MTAAWTPELRAPRPLATTRLPDAASWGDGWTALRQAVQSSGRASATIERVEIRFGPEVLVDPLAWLAAQPAGGRHYWADRDGSLVLAGVGVADVVTAAHAGAGAALDGLSDRLRHGATAARYFGHLSFGPSGGPSDGSTGLRLVLPRVELGRDKDGVWLAVHRTGGRALNRLGVTAATASLTAAAPQVLGSTPNPSRPDWCAGVARALDAIERGALKKVVLARASTLTTAAPVDPALLLARVGARDPETFRFLLERGPGDAFIGASPERLYRRDGRQVACDSLAGTRARGSDAQADAELGDGLLSAAKDRAEQTVVSDAIAGLLTPLSAVPVTTSGPTVRKFAHVQHLWTELATTLAPGVGDGTLLTALHPTPAVCGTPTTEARAMLTSLEAFAREHYAAPVGWVGADGAEFAVGLRSVRVRGRALTLFAGAGIVMGSVAEREWDELDAKDRGTLAALGANG